MHEMSIAHEVCRIAQEQVGEERCALVREVALEVGDLSGIEADNLLFWLEILLADPPFSGSRTVIHRVPGDVLSLRYLEIEDAGSPD